MSIIAFNTHAQDIFPTIVILQRTNLTTFTVVCVRTDILNFYFSADEYNIGRVIFHPVIIISRYRCEGNEQFTFYVLHFLRTELRQPWRWVAFFYAVSVYPLSHNSGVIALLTEDGVSVYTQL